MELGMRFLIIKLLDLCVYLCVYLFLMMSQFCIIGLSNEVFLLFFAQILGSLPLFELHYFMLFFQVK